MITEVLGCQCPYCEQFISTEFTLKYKVYYLCPCGKIYTLKQDAESCCQEVKPC